MDPAKNMDCAKLGLQSSSQTQLLCQNNNNNNWKKKYHKEKKLIPALVNESMEIEESNWLVPRQRGENRTQKECIEVEQVKLYKEIGLIEKG